MAQTVSKKDSPAKVERAARRHVRLAKRTKNAQAIEIAQRIEAPRGMLAEKIANAAAAREAAEDAFDDWVADDGEVDDKIASIGRKAKDYDADHPGARTYELLFQGQTPSDITYMAREEQPDAVVKLVQRAAALPPEHPVVALAPQLAEANERTRASHAAYLRALTAVAEADAAVETAKLAVIQVYRDNVIDIARAVGAELAERCFPRVRPPRRASSGRDDGGDAT